MDMVSDFPPEFWTRSHGTILIQQESYSEVGTKA